MRGRNCWLDDLPSSLTGKQNGVKWYSSNDVWTTLCAPTEPLPISGGYFTDWGPEISLGNKLFSEIGEDVYLVKHSKGGTTLAHDWNPELSNSLYHSLTARVFKSVFELGTNYEISGFFWMQGENDSIVSNYAFNYFSNLTNLINRLRIDFNTPNMPFILGMIHPNNNWPFVNVIRQAQTNIVLELPFVSSYDTSELSVCGSQVCDNVHYTPESIICLGEEFSDLWSQTIPEPFTFRFFLIVMYFIIFKFKI